MDVMEIDRRVAGLHSNPARVRVQACVQARVRMRAPVCACAGVYA